MYCVIHYLIIHLTSVPLIMENGLFLCPMTHMVGKVLASGSQPDRKIFNYMRLVASRPKIRSQFEFGAISEGASIKISTIHFLLKM